MYESVHKLMLIITWILPIDMYVHTNKMKTCTLHTQTETYTFIQTQTHIYIQTYTCIHTDTDIHIRTYTHKYTCIHTHTYICDQIWENLTLTHKDKYIEIHNLIIQ